MRQLRLTAVTEDGSRLLLADAETGEEFALPLDERVRSAARGDRERLGQLAVPLHGVLRPREIQARIRAGESAEHIAERSGMPVDAVARWEGPVIDERRHVADEARSAAIKRPDSPASTLGELVDERLDATRIDLATAAWDSWRREDGTWYVELTYRGAGGIGRAGWAYDPRRRVVSPLDDDARWLTGAERPAPVRPVETRPAVVAVPAAEPEPEQPEQERERGDAQEPGQRPAEEQLQQAASATAAGAPQPTRPAQPARQGQPARQQPASPQRRRDERARAARDADASKRRPSVPSWDDIVFGVKREE